MRILIATIVSATFVYALGGAIDHEHATASDPIVSDPTPPNRYYQGLTAYQWAQRAVQQRRNSLARGRTIQRLRAELRNQDVSPVAAIRHHFGAYAEQALRVAWCESRWSTRATNGQYLGLFQMGDYARSRYGHSHNALDQARAAYQYFAATGHSWSPWACKP